MGMHWQPVCEVNVEPLADWLSHDRPWPAPSTPTKPQRIHESGLPMELLQPIFDEVISYFDVPAVAHEPMLSRVLPGQVHSMHVDGQRPDWITRIHVPILTNEAAWIMFEDECEKIHFRRGTAYTFNTLYRHAFGNDGQTDRVHLLFELLKK